MSATSDAPSLASTDSAASSIGSNSGGGMMAQHSTSAGAQQQQPHQAANANNGNTNTTAATTSSSAQQQQQQTNNANANSASSSSLDSQIERLKRCEYLRENEVKALCLRAREILVDEGNVQRVDAPVTVRKVWRLACFGGGEECSCLSSFDHLLCSFIHLTHSFVFYAICFNPIHKKMTRTQHVSRWCICMQQL